MKKTLRLSVSLLLLGLLLGLRQHADAQLWKRIKNEVKDRVERQAVNTSGNAADAAVDKVKKGAAEAVKGEEAQAPQTQRDAPPPASAREDAAAPSVAPAPMADYHNYDFVPGDRIIFQPDLSSEPDGEMPARFTLDKGNAEIQSYEGQKLLHMAAGTRGMVSPLMNSSSYLPEQFTVEFDMMYENPDDNYFRYVNSFAVEFRDSIDKHSGNHPLYGFYIQSASGVIWGSPGTAEIKFPEAVTRSLYTRGRWHHIAVYVRKNIGKVYIDQYRVAASNTLPAGAGHLAILGDPHYGFKIKNMRIAAGGDDKYNKIVTDGKFITHGILFDVNSSVIKPESMGTLNEIARLMKDHGDLKFEIDGHTDSDGDDAANMKLSLERAGAVKTALAGMGIAGSRLSTKGLGETKPIDRNNTAEGKANNRRVEFIKL